MILSHVRILNGARSTVTLRISATVLLAHRRILLIMSDRLGTTIVIAEKVASYVFVQKT